MHLGDDFEIIRYIFGVICLLTALGGLQFSLIANELGSRALPPEKFWGDDEPFLMTEQQITNVQEVLQRARYQLQATKFYKASGAILFASVVAGLTINFPWLMLVGVLTIAATLYFFRKYWKEGNDAVVASHAWEAKLIETIKHPRRWLDQETEVQEIPKAQPPADNKGTL